MTTPETPGADGPRAATRVPATPGPLLDEKVVWVAGVGPGLGGACVQAALRDGARVVASARDGERLAARMEELDPAGERVLVAPADVTDAEACRRVAAAAVERFGALHGLVDVAALDNVMGGLDDTDDAAWAATHRVNVIGAMHLVSAVRPHLAAAGGGSVVFIGSQSSLRPADEMFQVAYAASKGALLAAQRSLARELGPQGIRVNTVIATWMWGPNVELYCAWQAAERGVTPEAVRDEIASRMALGEIPRDDDVAEAVVWLLSDRARMVTGQELLVNAGEIFGG